MKEGNKIQEDTNLFDFHQMFRKIAPLYFMSGLVFLLLISHKHPDNKLFRLKKSVVVDQNHSTVPVHTIKILANVHGSSKSNTDFVWQKYGREQVDWALIVNAWLCVQRESANETNLVAYSDDQVQVTKVSTNLQLPKIKNSSSPLGSYLCREQSFCAY